MDRRSYGEAMEIFLKALELVPEPRTRWEAGNWIYTALGEACYLRKDWPAAREYFRLAVLSPGGAGNPFLHMRRGQVFLEMGETDRAAQELAIAVASEGPGILRDEDPKYWKFISGVLAPPRGGRKADPGARG